MKVLESDSLLFAKTPYFLTTPNDDLSFPNDAQKLPKIGSFCASFPNDKSSFRR